MEENKKPQLDSSVIFRCHSNRVEEIILNHPSKLNAITYEMSHDIFERIKYFVDENSEEQYKRMSFCILNSSENKCISKNEKISNLSIPKIVILQSSCEKSFCAGGSLANLYEYKMKEEYDKLVSFYDYELSLDFFFLKMKPILISIWEGFVIGGGVGISINSKVRIATENTIFSMPETSIGFFPDVGAAYFLTRIFNKNPSIGLYCGLVGHRLIGEDCVKSGAATHFVKKEKLEIVKNILHQNTISDCDEEILIEKLNSLIHPLCDTIYSTDNFYFKDSQIINKIFLFDSVFDIFNRLRQLEICDYSEDYEKKWAQDTLSKLNKMSPQSLIIFFEYAKRALDFHDITESYLFDRKLFGRLIYDREFFEGIRSCIIDKDKNPIWNYNSIQKIHNVNEILFKFID